MPLGRRTGLHRRGGDVDHPAPARGEHVGQHFLGQKPGAAQVDADDLVEQVVVGLEERVERRDAGVVDQDGDRTQLLAGLFGGGVDRGLVGAIGINRQGGAAGVADHLRGLFGPGCVDVPDGDLGGVFGQAQRDCAADARTGAGDDRDAGVESSCHLVISRGNVLNT